MYIYQSRCSAGGVVGDRAQGEVCEQEDSSGSHCVSLMTNMIMAQSKDGGGDGRSERLGFICRWKRQDLLCTDSQGEGKKEIKVDSSCIWLGPG